MKLYRVNKYGILETVLIKHPDDVWGDLNGKVIRLIPSTYRNTEREAWLHFQQRTEAKLETLYETLQSTQEDIADLEPMMKAAAKNLELIPR